MNEMIEKVARVLCISSGVYDTNSLCTRLKMAEFGNLKVIPNESFIAPAWTFFVDDAKAVIKAMREPTEEMCNAPNTIIQSYGAKLIWQRMIDEILK